VRPLRRFISRPQWFMILGAEADMAGNARDLLANIRYGPRTLLIWIGLAAIVVPLAFLFHVYLGLVVLPFLAFGGLQASLQKGLGPAVGAAAPLPIHGGALAWDPPGTMRVGNMERISVRIGDENVALETLLDGLKPRNIILDLAIRMSTRMRVRLLAENKDFRIEALSSEDQYIFSGETGRWDFSVTPQRSGRRRLRLLASMRIDVDGQEELADLPAYEREVIVAVAPLYSASRFLKTNWKWIVTALILPVAGWLFLNTGIGQGAAQAIKSWLR
jgi:hypothetical protein